jgi:integrase
MPLRRDSRSPFWQYNFQIRGHRFFGSTKATNRRDAERVEAAEREKARALVGQVESARTSMRLDDIAGRYWQEVGQHHAGAGDTEHRLSLLIEFFGKDRLLTDISNDDVAKLVAWRRGHRTTSGKLISSFTVNHTTRQLCKLFTKAKLWGARFQHEPTWRPHLLPESLERVREVSDDEADKLDAAIRDDYRPFFDFARASGLRLTECLLKWSEVDWTAKQIRKAGKGGHYVTVPITSEIREILWPLRGHHLTMVFTYTPQRSDGGSERRPITYSGVQTYWQRLRKQTNIVGLRFHDLRHDFATKLLRDSRNFKLVQKALNHRNIATTLRYAHVLDEEVAAAMESAAKLRKRRVTRLKVV